MATVSEPETDPSPAPGAMPGSFAPHPLTVNHDRRMIDARIFGDREPIFQGRGSLVETMTRGDDPIITAIEFPAAVSRNIPDGWHDGQAQPFRLDDHSMPEPDLAVARGRGVPSREGGRVAVREILP